MNKIGTIRTFKTNRFSVVVDALYDDDVDLSFDDTGELLEKLQSGEYTAFAVRARVLLDGSEVASDYLGGCIYADIAEFQDHRQCAAQTRKLRADGSNAVVGSYFAEMVHNVISEARRNIAKLQSVHVRV